MAFKSGSTLLQSAVEEARILSRSLAYHRRARLEAVLGEALDEVDRRIEEMQDNRA